jgi:hypothetical protein
VYKPAVKNLLRAGCYTIKPGEKRAREDQQPRHKIK